MAGRKPKPTHLKLLQGNPGKRPINSAEPKPPAELPPAPEHLSAAAKTEWTHMGQQLLTLGLLTSIDRAAFAAYCVVWARWAEAEEALKKTGPVVRSSFNASSRAESMDSGSKRPTACRGLKISATCH
jgi:P27 family predicted phage terminase small subunit